MAGGRLWEPLETELVRAMGLGPAEVRRVARELARSEQAIRTRRYVLGLAVSDRWTRAETAELDRLVASGVQIGDAAIELGRPRRAGYNRRMRVRAAGVAVAVARRGGRVY